MMGQALSLPLRESALAGSCGHQLIELGILGETVDKRHKGAAILDEAAPSVSVGDIAHLQGVASRG